MDNQALMDNYLLILKSTVEVYVHGTLESTNQDIRNLLKNGLNETMIHQADTYDEMTKYGWYNVEDVKPQKINQLLMKVQGKN